MEENEELFQRFEGIPVEVQVNETGNSFYVATIGQWSSYGVLLFPQKFLFEERIDGVPTLCEPLSGCEQLVFLPWHYVRSIQLAQREYDGNFLGRKQKFTPTKDRG